MSYYNTATKTLGVLAMSTIISVVGLAWNQATAMQQDKSYEHGTGCKRACKQQYRKGTQDYEQCRRNCKMNRR